MLVAEPEKRYSTQQIKQHKWMKQLKVDDHYEISRTIGDLDRLNINHNEPAFDNDLKDAVTKLASRFSNVKIDICLESLMNKHFDDYYALYHLDKDFGSSSAQQSPSNLFTVFPRLPVIAASQRRRSSITTGIVERENSDPTICDLDVNRLSAVMNTKRRHTLVPESGSTPPNAAGQHIALNSCERSLNICLSIIPLQNMNRLKPPEVFSMVPHNMSRRVTDGQAVYYPNHRLQNSSMDSDENDYSLNDDGSNSKLDHHQQPNQHLSPQHIKLNNNPYMNSLNDQLAAPSPSLQFQSPLNALVYQLQPTQFQLPSSFSPYHLPSNRGSPYSSLDLKDKTNCSYSGRKRHSLTESFDLDTKRRVSNAAATANDNLTKSNNFNNVNNNLNNGHMNDAQCLPMFNKDLKIRRGSEGSGQLLQQQLMQFRPFDNDPSGRSPSRVLLVKHRTPIIQTAI